jgi:Calcium-binding EGF domain
MGYKGDAVKGCTDLDECAVASTKSVICPVNQGCVNTVGSFLCSKCGPNALLVKNKCQCQAGYQGDTVQGCTDINECMSNKTVCLARQGCVNMVGSFSCVPCGANTIAVKNQCQCKAGYQGDAIQGCSDTNECASNATVCPANQECRNTVGSFKCATCGANAVVVNNKCQCKPGYQGDAMKGCTDINECASITSNSCAAMGQKCENTVGSFACVPCGPYEQLEENACRCQSGSPPGNNGKCDLYEACAARNNTFWWHWTTGCECQEGYEGDPMVGCTDIDECASDFNWCHWYGAQVGNPRGYQCHNMAGSYVCDTCGPNQVVFDFMVKGDRCQCQAGFAPDADGVCQCTPGTSPCDNSGGPNTRMDRWNEQCICKEGYEGDPNSALGCVDIDECERGTHHCTYGAVVVRFDQWLPYQCRNVIGSYDCDPCGKNTKVVDMVNGRCECQDGFQGDPMVECK